MIGPEIPAHLLLNASAGGDSDEDEVGPSIGPQIPSGLTNSTPPEEFEEAPTHIGPQIPTELLKQQTQEQPVDDDDEDDYAPALPPELLVQRSKPSNLKSKSPSRKQPPTRASSSVSAPASGPPRRPIGPALPSHLSHHYQDDDSDDDDVGPKPLPSGLQPMHEKDAVAEFMEREERRRKNEEVAKEPKALKREEWMLVPPSASDLLGNLDTTKLKARQFARTSGPVDKGDNSLWTETPAERQQRIADEVAGKKRRAVDVANEEALGLGLSDRKRSKREEEDIRRGVDEYTKKLRGPSLVEQHGTQQKSEEDDEPKAIWDHSRDMAVGGRLMDDGKRNQMIREAKGLGDRFGSGKGGSFL